jgi:short-subunit dehydrogenase
MRVPVLLTARTVRRLDELAAEMTKASGIRATRSDAIRECIRRRLDG